MSDGEDFTNGVHWLTAADLLDRHTGRLGKLILVTFFVLLCWFLSCCVTHADFLSQKPTSQTPWTSQGSTYCTLGLVIVSTFATCLAVNGSIEQGPGVTLPMIVISWWWFWMLGPWSYFESITFLNLTMIFLRRSSLRCKSLLKSTRPLVFDIKSESRWHSPYCTWNVWGVARLDRK